MMDKHEYRLIWEDTFSSHSLDTTKWNYRYGNWIVDKEGVPRAEGWGNLEEQYYTDLEENITTKNGLLQIHALHKSSPMQNGKIYPFTSARIDTKGLFSFCYGKIEFRARCTSGAGVWPAVWLMPEEDVYGRWAASGEIDLLEIKGRLPKKVYGTIHYGNHAPDKTLKEHSIELPGDTDTTEFHTYEFYWERESISWYVDGHCYGHVTDWSYPTAPAPYPAPFDQKFYLLINLAIGGKFDIEAYKNVDTTAFPACFEVDYIRVYQ